MIWWLDKTSTICLQAKRYNMFERIHLLAVMLQMLSADELTSLMGVNVLPPIPPAAKMAVMSTPEKREFLETVMAMINSPSRAVTKQLERLVNSASRLANRTEMKL